MTRSVGALRRRRAGYARYAELIVAQIEAVDADDLDRFRSLAEERDELARRIDADEDPGVGAAGGDEDADEALAMAALGGLAYGHTADEGAREVEHLLGEVRLLLERCREHDARLREKLARLRDETRESIRDLERRRPGVQEYLQPTPERQARFDVRL